MLSDLDNTIEQRRHAVLLTPDGHPERPERLHELGDVVWARFLRSKKLSDLEEVIKLFQEALSLHPDGHRDKIALHQNLGGAFGIRYARTGVFSDLQETIRNLKVAVLLTPDQHPGKPLLLSNLGRSLRRRFEKTKALSDIDEAIETLQQAVLLTPDGHPDKSIWLYNLGSASLNRFQHTRALIDVEESIKHLQEAALLIPEGHSERPALFSNLGSSLQSRFTLTRALSDIEGAIINQVQAVLLTPDRHPDKPHRLSNLGNSFACRFVQTQELSDIKEAVKNLQAAVSLIPDGHPNKPALLNSLGSSLQIRFELKETMSDLEEAIKSQVQAVSFTPDEHPHKPRRLSNLASSLRCRFEETGLLSDVDEAINNLQKAILLTPDQNPVKSSRLRGLARCFQSRYRRTKVSSDLDAAMLHFRSAATSTRGSPSVRSRSSRDLAHLLASRDPTSALDAYRLAIDLFPMMAWIGDPISARHSQLTRLGDLPREAAAFALGAGQPNLALEWLEQGRSVVWNQLLSLCASDDRLYQAHPNLHAEFLSVSRQLQNAANREQRTELLSEIGLLLEKETQDHHRLAERWDLLVDQIRCLPGFEDFLWSRKIPSLRKAAESGPVVIINIHKRRCDALVLIKGRDNVLHIPLKELSYAGVEEMVGWVKRDLLKFSGMRGENRGSASYKNGGPRMKKVLSRLFSTIVCPVLQGLDMMVKRPDPFDLPRIWWCPTGPLTFLPLHAAGVDIPGDRDEVSNYVVSSYIPTVNALLEARARARQPFNQLLGIAMTNNPPHHGLNPLPCAQIELEKIGNLFTAGSESTWKFLSLRNEQATTEQVLADMANCSWVHLACHAKQDAQKPTESGLWLRDRPLTIMDLISKRFDQADFAFLSACQTAAGDEKSSDEAVHITAAMLGAGYRSVIGTMWPIPDDVAPILGAKVYEDLLSGAKPDSEKAARALHKAIKDFRKAGKCSFYAWVPFVHYGV